MSARTKEQLKQDFSDNQTATGAKFADLIDSLKAVQSAVSDPSANGLSVDFIATISQNTEGKITATKKSVNFIGYQTTNAMRTYQNNDLQKTGTIQTDAQNISKTVVVAHNMGHYPTVRLLDNSGEEIIPSSNLIAPFGVIHTNINNLSITLSASLNSRLSIYTYVLD